MVVYVMESSARGTGATMTDGGTASVIRPVAPERISLAGVVLALVAVLSVSTSAVFIRLAGQVSPYEIAFWRLVVASAVLAPAVWLTGAWPAVRAVGLRRFALYGAILSAHFITYNLGLRYAPVAHVLPLIYTSTIFIAILSAVVLREPLRRAQLAGIGVVIAGAGILAGFEPRFDPRVLLGDGFAVLSAITFALYSMVGRQQRQRVPLFGYAVGVYAMAALWTAPLAALAAWSASDAGAASSRYSLQVVLSLLALGLVPNAIGHTLYNASVRRLNAAVANVLFTQEVTGAIVLAWLILGETPTTNALVGAAVMLAGILVVLLR